MVESIGSHFIYLMYSLLRIYPGGLGEDIGIIESTTISLLHVWAAESGYILKRANLITKLRKDVMFHRIYTFLYKLSIRFMKNKPE